MPRRLRHARHAARRRSCGSSIVVPGFILLYVLDQKSLLPEEGVD